MSVLHSHTRQAGLLTNLLALALLTLPIPTQAVDRSESTAAVASLHSSVSTARQTR
ncbi:MAG: hypothetical protein ACN6O6_23815 [Pseudomonas sp.]|uniref:hypothetical protein n=1 Tax=Pseudomonas sp. TaxID=306 RepID=UPI003D12E07C